jgi:hypothetical protein
MGEGGLELYAATGSSVGGDFDGGAAVASEIAFARRSLQVHRGSEGTVKGSAGPRAGCSPQKKQPGWSAKPGEALFPAVRGRSFLGHGRRA